MGQLYCDLDGVLGDFYGGIRFLTGKEWMDPSYTNEKEKWDQVNKVPRFWARLPKMPDAQWLWDQIAPYDPWVLTACPREMPQGEEDKKDWCVEQLGVPRERVIVVFSRHQKKEYAFSHSYGTPNILIDDYLPNVADWRNAGGIGIHHVNVTKSLEQFLALT